MYKLTEREKEILSMNFTTEQINSAIESQRKLEEYNEKLMEGIDAEKPNLTMEEKKNMDLYFIQKSIKDTMKLKI